MAAFWVARDLKTCATPPPKHTPPCVTEQQRNQRAGEKDLIRLMTVVDLFTQALLVGNMCGLSVIDTPAGSEVHHMTSHVLIYIGTW